MISSFFYLFNFILCTKSKPKNLMIISQKQNDFALMYMMAFQQQLIYYYLGILLILFPTNMV